MNLRQRYEIRRRNEAVRRGSLKEQTLGDGSTEYGIKYKFVKNYYDQAEIDDVLKAQFPDIYMMSKAGILKDISIYRFVDKNTGKILTNVAYNSIRTPACRVLFSSRRSGRSRS